MAFVALLHGFPIRQNWIFDWCAVLKQTSENNYVLFDLLPCLTFSPVGLCTAHPLGLLLPLDPILLSVRSQTAKMRREFHRTHTHTLTNVIFSQEQQIQTKKHQSAELERQLLTVSNVRPGLKLCSHCIISKKIGMVAFLSSGSGTSVTSRMGPTMAGMNFILWGPEGEETL